MDNHQELMAILGEIRDGLDVLCAAAWAEQKSSEDLLEKLLGEGGPDTLESSLDAIERMRSQGQ